MQLTEFYYSGNRINMTDVDRLKSMQVLVSIADHGSLTAAAEALGVSLPAVVRALAALEADLGVRLFNRTTRRIAVTDEGRRYLEDSRRILQAVVDAGAALSAGASEPQGRLSLTAPVLFGQIYVAPAVASFVRRYPKVSVDVQLFDRVTNLVEEGFDAAVRIGKLTDSTLIAQNIGSLRTLVVASPGYLRRVGVPRHPRDLLRANCVHFSGTSPPWWVFHKGGKRITIPVRGNLAFNHVAPVVEACAAGLGFGRLISYQAAAQLARGTLKVVLEDFEPAARPLSLVYPQARFLPNRTRLFLDWMKRELARTIAS
jgi:DNA-binding transcriptional LysR family regulator